MVNIDRCIKLTRYFYREQERSNYALENQLKEAQDVLSILVKTTLLDHQREALVCLISDLLGGFIEPSQLQFRESFLIKALNKEMMQIAAAEFFSFCYKHGRVDQKLWNKRQCEYSLFVSGLLQFENK